MGKGVRCSPLKFQDSSVSFSAAASSSFKGPSLTFSIFGERELDTVIYEIGRGENGGPV